MKRLSFKRREQLKKAQEQSHKKDPPPDSADDLTFKNQISAQKLPQQSYELHPELSNKAHLDALRFAFAVLVTGSSYSQSSEFEMILGHDPPKEDVFYHKQKVIEAAVAELLQEKLSNYQNQVIKEGKKFVACFDGAFSHPRNANSCIVDIIHPKHRKIFAFAIIEKQTSKNRVVDFNESTKSLEITDLKDMLMQWKKYDIFEGYCHDLDSSAKTLIENMGLKLKEFFDHNHCSKHFQAIFNGVQKKYPKSLFGIQKKLQIHFSICVHADKLTSDEKENKWRGCFNHFTSADSKWAKKDNETSRTALKLLIENCSSVFAHILSQTRTQLNEAFHSLKCKYADKRLSYSRSWKMRIHMSILEFNWPGIWKLELAMKLGINLSASTKEELIKLYKKKSLTRYRKREAAYLKKEREYRLAKRESNSVKDEQTDDYLPKDSPKKEWRKDFNTDFKDRKVPSTSMDKPLPKNSIQIMMPSKNENMEIEYECKGDVFRFSFIKSSQKNLNLPNDEAWYHHTYKVYYYSHIVPGTTYKLGPLDDNELDTITCSFIALASHDLYSPSVISMTLPGRNGSQMAKFNKRDKLLPELQQRWEFMQKNNQIKKLSRLIAAIQQNLERAFLKPADLYDMELKAKMTKSFKTLFLKLFFDTSCHPSHTNRACLCCLSLLSC